MSAIDWNHIARPRPTHKTLALRVEELFAGSANRAAFDGVAMGHDRWDYVHFRDCGIGRGCDVWDNRHKAVA